MDNSNNTGGWYPYTVYPPTPVHPCPTCGRCPTCGAYKPVPQPYVTTTTNPGPTLD